MQGHVDSALYVQATSEECYASLLLKHLLVWIDDILVYAKDPEEYIQVLREFFGLVDRYGFKLSPSKTVLFTSEVKWCGCILSGEGVRQDPARIEQLCAIPYPTNAGDLQQFICAVNWIRESITEYAMTVEPLQQALNKALEGKAKKKRIASGIKIELTQEEKAAFDAVKSKMRTAVDLSHPRADATLCLFTDASDQGWSIIVTQVDKFDDELPIQEQSHEMLVCQSGMFTGAQKSWSVIEKEAYPIARACEKLNYLLMRPEGFRMYCDHKNLIHIFVPGKEWPEHTRGKLMRWAAIIGGYRYTIEHINGIHNLWADMMSRWGRPATGMATHKVLAARWTKKRKQPRHMPKRNTLRPLDEENFIWPCINDIVKAQAAHANTRPKEAKRTSDDQPWIVDGRLWIPAAAEDLIQRIMVVAHCGSMGHRGQAALVNHVKRLFWIERLNEQAGNFIAGCLLCPHVQGGRVVHRPYAPTWHAKRRNEGLHFDYLFMGEALGGSKYVLVLKDDLTHFCELVA
ncbi:hypothetical protein AeRB84_020220 [Aphanomyces euteiches]|nr:hypothetical protein AeRB84_020220 [Aphanomyces euteiches]